MRLPPQIAHWAKPVSRYFESIAFTAGARPFAQFEDPPDDGYWANYETAPVVNAARLEMLGAIPPSV